MGPLDAVIRKLGKIGQLRSPRMRNGRRISPRDHRRVGLTKGRQRGTRRPAEAAGWHKPECAEGRDALAHAAGPATTPRAPNEPEGNAPASGTIPTGAGGIAKTRRTASGTTRRGATGGPPPGRQASRRGHRPPSSAWGPKAPTFKTRHRLGSSSTDKRAAVLLVPTLFESPQTQERANIEVPSRPLRPIGVGPRNSVFPRTEAPCKTQRGCCSIKFGPGSSKFSLARSLNWSRKSAILRTTNFEWPWTLPQLVWPLLSSLLDLYVMGPLV